MTCGHTHWQTTSAKECNSGSPKHHLKYGSFRCPQYGTPNNSIMKALLRTLKASKDHQSGLQLLSQKPTRHFQTGLHLNE